MSGRWLELADGVFARRYAELDLTVGLVLGTERALVIDTRGDGAQGAELAASVRAITQLPLVLAITHAHFDHCFGTSAFQRQNSTPMPVYAQRGCVPWLRETAEAQRSEWVGYYRSRGQFDTAQALAEAEVVLPDTPVDHAADIELGDRLVRLLHPGPGHTDHDLVVQLPGSGVLFAGDLVEQGAPPDFGDADPLRWPEAVKRLLALEPEVVVPGHGDPVPPSFVAGQLEELTAVAQLCRQVRAGELTEPEALAASPYPAKTMRVALVRSGCAEDG